MINPIHLLLNLKLEKKKITYSDEDARLDQKNGYTVLGTSSSRVIDELASYTARIFNSKIAIINFVDQHDVWPKKGQAMDKLSGVYTETNVCSLAFINEIEDHLEVSFEEFIAVPALATNALIAAEFGMRFYAAVPITSNSGVQIGTVCILDKLRRELLPQEREKLSRIAEMVKRQMSKRATKKICA